MAERNEPGIIPPSVRIGGPESAPVSVRESLPLGLGVIAVVVVLGLMALDHGGVSAYAWGWTTIPLAVIGIILIVVRGLTVPSRLELIPVAALWGLVLWAAVSALWAGSAGPTMLEAERLLLYAVLLTLLTGALGRRSVETLVESLVVMVAVIDLVALWSKLIAIHKSSSAAGRVNRLQTPFDYWNALAIFTVLGLLLALGLVLMHERREVRMVAAGLVPAAALVVYFTFSRGALLGLAAGLVVLLAVPADRLRRVGVAAMLAAPTLLLLAFAATQHQLARHQPSPQHPRRLHRWLLQAAHQGDATVVILLFAIAGCCVLALYLPQIEERVNPSAALRRVLGYAVIGATVLAVVVVLALKGSPVNLVTGGLGPLDQPPPSSFHNLNDRLASVSLNGRGRFWDAAWNDFVDHPLVGSGGGTFRRYWLEHRTVPADISDAHSFILQTAAELGLIGLVLLGCVLVPPILAAVRNRRDPMVVVLAAGLAAFLVHAATDRDWEVPAVACFALCLVAALGKMAAPVGRRQATRRERRWAQIALACVCVLGVWTFAGNLALSRARADLASHHYTHARRAASIASTLMPWSAGGPIALGQVDVGEGDIGPAGAQFQDATGRDSGRWVSWWGLGQFGPPAGRSAARDRAARLNPLGVARLEQPGS